MARSLLGAFVSGARTLLAVQLLLSVLAIALVGWTLGVTSGVIRERDLLRERVVQLESAMAERGMVVPPTQTVVSAPATDTAPYPDELGAAIAGDSAESDSAGFGQIITGLFAPAPPMRVVVLHVRNELDAQQARVLAQTLASDSGLSVVVHVMAQGDGRLSGYTYFDGRQNRAAGTPAAAASASEMPTSSRNEVTMTPRAPNQNGSCSKSAAMTPKCRRSKQKW